MGLPIYEGTDSPRPRPSSRSIRRRSRRSGRSARRCPASRSRSTRASSTRRRSTIPATSANSSFADRTSPTATGTSPPQPTAPLRRISASDGGELTEHTGDGQWFRTGDVVHRREDGYLEFRERTKQIIVLSTGKNVAPAPIEDAFAASEVVEQCMVVGDERKFIGALLVPNTDHVREWAETEGIELPDDPATLCENARPRVRR